MNWKLLLIALMLTVGTSARPAEEAAIAETSTLKAAPESTTFLSEKTTTKLEVVTKKLSTTAEPAPTEPPATVRYLLASMPTTKTTNDRLKYANNYANLITKHTLSNNRISNGSSNNSNMLVSLHGVVVDSSLPAATIASSATTSNSSSKPLVFVDFDYVNPTITTKRAFVPLKGANGLWANYNLEPPRVVTTRPKKPVIHKIISKWSDNPIDVFNLHNEHSHSTTQASHINDLKNHLIHNSFNPGMLSASFDQLPAILGQQFLNQHNNKLYPTSSPTTNVISVLTKRPNGDATKNNCKRVKIKFGNAIGNDFGSKENCDDINIEIDNKIENMKPVTSTTTVDYAFPNNDKFEDSTSNDDYDSDEKQEGVTEEAPQVVNSITQIKKPEGNKQTLDGTFGDAGEEDKRKKKKKKKPGIASQIDGGDGDDDTPDVGSMVMTMMTMMAVFNPLNFGVWGIIMAPMAAMLFGGICFAMYNFAQHPMSKPPAWPAHPPWQSSWPKPQEIIIKNHLKHSPIPIKVMHLHKNTYSPPPKEHYSEPMISYGPPMLSYHSSKPQTSYGEPPMIVDDYHPSAPSGGPYKRKSNFPNKKPSKTRNSYKFKLL